ncbi:hypothetical protein ACX3O0_09525 [Homoserinimonas sp. A447]
MRTVNFPGAALVLGCLLLAGCASAPTEGPPSIPDGETAAETAIGPVPLLSIGCEELIELTAVQEALGSVEPGTDPVRVPGGSWALSQLGIAQAGALECYWGDDAAPQGEYARYLIVTVLPGAAQAWQAQQSELASWSQPFAGHGDAGFADCDGSANYRSCTYDVLVGANWLHAEVMNLDALEDAAPIIRILTDSVAAADPVEATWSATTILPTACGDWLTAEEINTALGMEGIAERDYPLSMPIILNEGLSGGLACSWSNSYSSVQAMPVGAAALPDAEWAWDAAWAKPRPDRNPATPLGGIGDQAYSGCATDENVCFVDVLSNGTWITVHGNKEAGIDGLTQIAALALANLGG